MSRRVACRPASGPVGAAGLPRMEVHWASATRLFFCGDAPRRRAPTDPRPATSGWTGDVLEGRRAALATTMARVSVVPSWPITSVALAAALLAMPLTAKTPLAASRSTLIVGLSYAQIGIVAVIGVAVGWVVLDRLAAFRVRLRGMVVVVVGIVTTCGLAGYVSAAYGYGLGRPSATILALAVIVGGLIRGVTVDRRSMASLVALAGVTSWLTYDVAWLPYQPLRDIHLYLDAGARALSGASPYSQAQITSVADLEKLPFVYPPPTIPLFEVLAIVPRPIADALWIGGSIAAVIAALWLLGVRGRWLLVLLAWPPVAVGLAVGNVAAFTFLLYAAGFRAGTALILSGVFKPQSTIPALWFVRERRWRPIAAGVGIVAVLALIALPLTGRHAWIDWLNGLRYFQGSIGSFPSIQGLSITRGAGPVVSALATVVAIGFAFLGRHRNGLARFGLASVVASPTLSIHGLLPLLPGASVLGPEMLWFFLGLGPWLGSQSAWLAMALVGLALFVAPDDGLSVPPDLTPSRADMHPLALSGQAWPDRA